MRRTKRGRRLRARFSNVDDRFYTIDASEANQQQNATHFRLPLIFWVDARSIRPVPDLRPFSMVDGKWLSDHRFGNGRSPTAAHQIATKFSEVRGLAQ